MNWFKTDYCFLLIMFMLTMHGTTHASQRSLSETKDIIPQHSALRAHSMSLAGTDYEYFTRHAQSFAEDLMSHTKSAKKSISPQERVAIRHHLLQHMIDYKHAHDLPLFDLQGNEIPTALDHREIVFLDNLLVTLTFGSLRASPLSGTITEHGILPFLYSSPLLSLIQKLFGTQSQELPSTFGDRSFAISEDGSTIAISYGKDVHIYQCNKVSKTWKCRHIFNIGRHILGHHIIAVHPEGLTIITNSLFDDNTCAPRIHRFNTVTHQGELHRFNHTSFFRPSCIAINRDGSTMIVGFDHKKVRFYQCNSSRGWNHIKTITTPDYIQAIGIHDATIIIIVSISDDKFAKVYRFDSTTNRLTYQRTFNTTTCNKSVAISADCSTIASIPHPHIVQMYRFDNNTQHWVNHNRITLPTDSYAKSVFVTADNSTLIVGLQNCTAQIYHYNSVNKRWELQHTLNHTTEHPSSIADATVSLDGLTAVTRVMFRKTIHRVGLTQEEIQSIMPLIRNNFDLFLLLYDLHRKDEIYPYKPAMLSQEQLNTLAKLPLRALKILVARYNLRIREQGMKSALAALPEKPSSLGSLATSSGTTEAQLAHRQLATVFAPEISRLPISSRTSAPSASTVCSIAKTPPLRKGSCCTIS